MLVHILWFVLGLILLIKGGDWFVDGSVGVAKKFKVPDLLIGATVVSIGTTLPEVMVSSSGALSMVKVSDAALVSILFSAKTSLISSPDSVHSLHVFVMSRSSALTAFCTGVSFMSPVIFVLMLICIISLCNPIICIKFCI